MESARRGRGLALGAQHDGVEVGVIQPLKAFKRSGTLSAVKIDSTAGGYSKRSKGADCKSAG